MNRLRDVLILFAILAFGAAIRASYLSELVRSPDFANPGVDAAYHDYWARGLATGNWTPPPGSEDPLIRTTPFFRPPGYPYFLALVYSVFGPNYLAPRLVQMFLGLLNCGLAYAFGRRWFGRTTGLVFAGLMSFYWIFICFEGELLEPALLTTLLLSFAYMLSLWTERITVRRALAAGVLLGLCALTRPNALVAAVGVLGWAFWLSRRKGDLRGFVGAAAAFVLAAALAIAPATIRNYVVARDFVLISSNGGINLYLGNNEFAQGLFLSSAGIGRFGTSFDYPRVVASLGHGIKHSQAWAIFTRRAISYVRAHPGRTLKLMVQKALMFWGPAEISHNKDESQQRAHSTTLRRLPGSFPAVLALAAVGIALVFSSPPISTMDRRRREVAAIVLIVVALYFASFLPFFVTAQYRAPVIPFLLLFGAYGIERFANLLRERRLRAAVACLVLLAGAYGLVSVNWAGYRPQPGKWNFDRGVAYLETGRTDRAIVEFGEALRLDPNYAQAHFNLGVALARQGALENAIASYRRALQLRPDYADAHNNLGTALARQGRLSEAIAEFGKALKADPMLAAAHYNLGVALWSRGDAAAAVAHWKRTIAIKPKHASAHYRLAKALYSAGELAQARRELQKARELGLVPDPAFLRELQLIEQGDP